MSHTAETNEAVRSGISTLSRSNAPAGIQNTLAHPDGIRKKITTLVDHHREGRFVIAFCPLCDHAAEAEDVGTGRDHAASVSVAKIEAHLRRIHRKRAAA